MSSSVAIITLESFIPDNWRRIFAKIVTMREWHDLEKTYAEFEISGQTIFPAKHAIFHAFQLVDPHDVRVVIIGQDPYHQPGQAMGLAFSVPDTCRPIPPSLRNIAREVDAEYPDSPGKCPTDLTFWAKQGVLLLNSALTVRISSANSHAKLWKPITDALIVEISMLNPTIVWSLWGNFAREKAKLLSSETLAKREKLVVEAVHPSPLSASQGWFGSDVFKRINNGLENPDKFIIWKNPIL